jgi:hypothetical protein
MCVVPLLALGACKDDGVTVQPPPAPTASVRFINAVVDTGAVDLRFVDKVENLPTLQGVAFRGVSGFYQGVIPGSRAARVFPNETNVNLATPALLSTRLVDTTVPLAAGTRYTLVYAGRAKSGTPAAEAHRLAVITDPAAPTPPANSITLKMLNVAVGMGNLDVYVVPVASTTAATPADWATNNAGVVRNVAYLAQSAYANFAVRPTTGLPFYRFVVTAAGSTTELFAATPNQPGIPQPAGATYGAQPGVQISGSVMTVVLAPGSTPGTRQSTAATQTPTVMLVSDKVLNP